MTVVYTSHHVQMRRRGLPVLDSRSCECAEILLKSDGSQSQSRKSTHDGHIPPIGIGKQLAYEIPAFGGNIGISYSSR